MTKRKIFAIIIALMMCVTLVACSTQEQIDTDIQSKYGHFVLLENENIEDTEVYQYIMYDPNTMVMYTYVGSFKGGGLSVMYNPDGTLKLYFPNDETE